MKKMLCTVKKLAKAYCRVLIVYMAILTLADRANTIRKARMAGVDEFRELIMLPSRRLRNIYDYLKELYERNI